MQLGRFVRSLREKPGISARTRLRQMRSTRSSIAFPVSKVQDAYRYLESSAHFGKIVIDLSW